MGTVGFSTGRIDPSGGSLPNWRTGFLWESIDDNGDRFLLLDSDLGRLLPSLAADVEGEGMSSLGYLLHLQSLQASVK